MADILTLIGPRDLVGSVIYLLGMVIALSAGWRRSHDPARSPREALCWYAIAAIFAGLAIWRVLNGDAWLHDISRAQLIGEEAYRERRGPQWIAVMAVALAMALGLVAAYRWSRSLKRPDRIALSLAIILLAYSLVRAISLHAVDRIIYAFAGPVNFNRVFDLGVSILVPLLTLPRIRRFVREFPI